MALRDADRTNWRTLQTAIMAGHCALIESRDLASGEYRALLCAMNRDKAGNFLPTPMAVMVWNNPYEQFADPTQDTLPPAAEPKDIPEVRKLTQVIETKLTQVIKALRAAQDELSVIADGIAEALEP